MEKLKQNILSEKHGRHSIPPEQIISEIRELYQELGYPPHTFQYKRSLTARHKFNCSWQEVITQVCGIKATYYSSRSQTSKEEIIYNTKEALKRIDCNGTPTWKQLVKAGVQVGTLSHYWSSLKDFYAEFGLKTKGQVHKEMTEKEVKYAVEHLLKQNKKITVGAIVENSNITSFAELESFLLVMKYDERISDSSLISYLESIGFSKRDLLLSGGVRIGDRTYPTLTEAAQHLNLTTSGLKSRLQKYGSDFPYLTYKGVLRPVKLGGKIYPNQYEAANKNKVDLKTIQKMIKTSKKEIDK